MSRSSLLALLQVTLLVVSLRGAEPYFDALRLSREKQHEQALEKLRTVLQHDPSHARGYRAAVKIYLALGKADEARLLFESIAMKPSSSAYGHYALGVLRAQQRDNEAALRHLKTCLELAPDFLPAYRQVVDVLHSTSRAKDAETMIASAIARNPGNAAAHFAAGHLARLNNDAKRALPSYTRAAELSPDSFEIADGVYYSYYSTDRVADAIEVLKQMLARARSRNDPEWEGIVLGRLGLIWSEQGEYSEALSHLGRGIDLMVDLGNTANEQAFRAYRGVVYIYLADYAAALEECRRSLALARDLRLRLSEGRTLGLIASIHAELAEYSQAIDAYTQSVAIAREMGDGPSEADQLASLALMHSALGDHNKAVELTTAGLAIARKVENPWREGRCLEVLGSAYLKLGRRQSALNSYRRAFDIAQRLGDKFAQATRLSYAAAIRVLRGEYTSAAQDLELALQTARGIGARLPEANILNQIGNVHLRRGRPAAALDSHRQALTIGLDTRMPELVWQAHTGLGAAFEKQGLDSQAEQHYREAIAALENIRSALPLAIEKAGFLGNRLEPYERAIHLSAAQNRISEAFHYAERARARSTLDLLAASRAITSRGIDPALAARKTEIEARLSQLQAQLLHLYSKQPPDRVRIARLSSELDAVDETYTAVQRELYARHPEAQPFDLEQARRALPEKTVLLVYSLGERASFLFALTRDRHRFAKLAPSSVIEGRVRELRGAISGGAGRVAFSRYVEQARDLYRELIEPAQALLPDAAHLIVVPDGALHLLPFEALLSSFDSSTPLASGRLPYLLRKYSVSYAPSASVLAMLMKRQTQPRAHDLLAVGDPRFSNLRRLHESRRETEGLGRVYPRAKVTLLLGADATEHKFKSAVNLSGYRILHLATHGLINEAKPQFSGLALGSSGPQDDGMLQAYEILNLRLDADLVVLSACETALGRRIRGEGLIGLTQAFLYAGARSVAVSLWKVEDRAAADLMIRFHRHLQPGGTKSEALRRAQLELIDSGSSHPFLWAAFILIGDWRALAQ